MSTIADRLRVFVDDEMTFSGNHPDTVIPELVTALCGEVQRLLLIRQETLRPHAAEDEQAS